MFHISHIRYIGKQYGCYTIRKAVGEGRYGHCFLACSDSGDQVVIKRLKSGHIKKNREKIIIEAVALSQIEHKSIPQLLGIINEKDFYAFILERKPGVTVDSLLFKEKHLFTDEEIREIFSQLIETVEYLHKKGIIHGDIRPSNVLLNNGKIYLVDFGLSRWADSAKETYNIDFLNLGDFLLYLLYSSHKSRKRTRLAWYDELTLLPEQQLFIKKLMLIEAAYTNITEVKTEFNRIFG
ncbi:protein kinase domain-containing protein [Macellibacteroides fermentans]|uniref:protein kinase domain-containing protein n=1 Tax=Macellibacteroides fermentans TaxID=879969 RepID=UPI00406CE460